MNRSISREQSSPPLSVVFDIAALGQGGMERQLIDLAAGLVNRGHDVAIVVNKQISAYAQELSSARVTLVELGTSRRFGVSAHRGLSEVCRARQADVVVGVNFNGTFWSRTVGHSLRIATVIWEHSTDLASPFKVVMSNHLLGPWTDAVVACAEAQVPSLVLAGSPADRIVVVRNGVDCTQFQRSASGALRFKERFGIPPSVLTVGLIGGHRREKRHDRFIELVSGLRRGGVPVWGIAIGGGPDLAKNIQLADEAQLADSMVFTGGVEDVTAAYSACDVCVLCSDSETLPLSLMEAQACETPVVAMQVGGVAETFDPGTTGVLVQQGDVEGFEREVARLLANAELRADMGAAGRAWVSANRSLEAMVEGYAQVLRVAVARAAERRG